MITYKTSDGKEFNNLEDAQKHDATLGFDEFHHNIHQDILKNNETINLLNSEIKRLQRCCSHPAVKIKATASTGNWCQSDDRYWYDIECKCCLKKWREDQEDSKYKTNDINVEWMK